VAVLQARPAGLKDGRQHVWCPGCDDQCQFGPCPAPDSATPAVVGVASNLGMALKDPSKPDPSFDVWRLNSIEESLLALSNYDTVPLSITCTYGAAMPWKIKYGPYGGEVHGRSLRETLDYCITMLHEILGEYEGGDEEEDEDYEDDACDEDPF
jgi:hypothetical protein